MYLKTPGRHGPGQSAILIKMLPVEIIKTKRGKEKGRKNGNVGMAIGKALSECSFLRHISYTYIL